MDCQTRLELAARRHGCEPKWQASLGALRIRAVRRTGDPADRTVIRLAGTDYQARSDSAGSLEINDLVPGPYAAVVVDSVLAPLDLTIPTAIKFTAERDSVARFTLRVPTAKEYVADACLAASESAAAPLSGTAWLLARVTSSRDVSVTRLPWRISLVHGPDDEELLAEGRLGADGSLPYCKLERGMMIRISVLLDAKAPRVVTHRLEDELTIVPIVLRPN